MSLNKIEYRKSTENDIKDIMNIINEAQEYFKINGIDQWQNNYPNVDTIKNDINNGWSYVLIKDNEIVATTALSFDKEKTYENIYDGKWISNSDYAVIHRIAVKSKCKGMGISSEIMKNAQELCLEKDIHSIKIDTHKDNLSMQKLLKKNGFKYCGIIYLTDGNERVAFEKNIL